MSDHAKPLSTAIGSDLAQRLIQLDAQHRAERPAPDALVHLWTRGVALPEGGRLPESDALLDRLYGDAEGGFVPREKKPMVVDTRRSNGAYMVSVDREPLVIMDACSQIATVTHGFRNPHVVQAVHGGRFGRDLWSNPDTRVRRHPVVEAYAKALVDRAPAGLDHACFVTAGGAEANEKALRIARMHAPPTPDGVERKRVLAFRHGFHGRTLVALMSTWNPVKRGPFEFAGYETVFAEANAESLVRVLEDHSDEIYGCIIEPMQAEGGDLHLDPGFLRVLRAETRSRGIPLVVDEVQTGFGTGGSFYWWQRHGLGEDAETAPDLLTLAKKAGLGVVLSRWPDPEPAPVNVASVLRGLIHAEHAQEQDFLEAAIAPRLEAFAREHGPTVTGPRGAGTTFAFDLPDADAVKAFIGQRFQRGFMTYQAGQRTIRFRLGAQFGEPELEELFDRIGETVARLDDESATEWPSVPAEPRSTQTPVRIRPATRSDWDEVQEIEAEAYEPVRRMQEDEFLRCVERGIGFVAEGDDGGLLGCSFAAPLELYAETAGPDRDENLGLENTLYSADVTLREAARGLGLGLVLKGALIDWAREAGYRYVSGRNKVGATPQMRALNRSFGAVPVVHIDGQYGGTGTTEYYRIPVGAPPTGDTDDDGDTLDVASGLQAPFGSNPAFAGSREIVGPASCRLNLSNYATLDTVQYGELLRAVCPRGTGHMYVTSSRDETVDKSLRCLRLGRKDGQIAIGLQGGYVGHTTAAARSLSDPDGFGAHFGLFDFPRLPHPADGIEAFSEALDGVVAQHGSESILGLYAEVVGERSGKVLDGEGARALAQACRGHDIPLVLVETATGGFRGGEGVWGLDGLPREVVPDMVLWYPGGQVGHIFVGDRYFIDKPLTLISTWDGDQVSMIRVHEQLLAAASLDLAPAIEALDRCLSGLLRPGVRAGGTGLYRTLTFQELDAAARVAEIAGSQGLLLGRGAPDTLVLAPALDIAPAKIETELAPTLGQAFEDAGL